MIYFLDSTGNPLPAGILVTLTGGTGFGQFYTKAGGWIDVEPEMGAAYTATFVGTFAPESPQSFTLGIPPGTVDFTGSVLVDSDGAVFVDSDGLMFASQDGTPSLGWTDDGNRNVTIDGYASPILSRQGFADKLFDDQPRGWYPPKDQAPNVYTALYSIAAVLDILEQGQQIVLGKERLHSSFGSDIDTWANDYIGFGVWQRAPGESDQTYIARCELWLKTDSTTDYGLQVLLQAWMDAWGLYILNPHAVEGISYDNLGGFDDLSGGFDNAGQPLLTQPPQVVVFDWMSNPSLSYAVGLQRGRGQFCILLLYAGQTDLLQWYIGGGFSGVNTFLAQSNYYSVAPFSNAFQRIVQLRKAQGAWPIYSSNKQPISGGS